MGFKTAGATACYPGFFLGRGQHVKRRRFDVKKFFFPHVAHGGLPVRVFKALANVRWDTLLKTDIVSPEYIEGCYMLGKQYLDPCARIVLLGESSRR